MRVRPGGGGRALVLPEAGVMGQMFASKHYSVTACLERVTATERQHHLLCMFHSRAERGLVRI